MPDWQCPACGVAYAKVQLAGAQEPPPATPDLPLQAQGGRMLPMSVGRWLLLLAVLAGLWAGFGRQPQDGFDAAREGAVKALAASVQEGEILMYGFEACPYCKQARKWLDRYGFAYSVCDIRTDAECDRRLAALGQNSVPYLIVRGHHLSGFDADEFLAALDPS
ncbi:glutaredoxin family protein [Solimonas sp. K1W22B-7]|uniref:glutaredoxin family protein n=1 Tax=Solimonas sp. K1W22B-7 TaxID=2303331 RepID=UPI0019690466|nr:glutaredoxin family protein [Solimonas sp. K1W22B-7]